jgi:hypothetical protein
MTNMSHPPQEVLIKVMCSEHFPKKEGYYKTNIGEIYYSEKYVSFINEFGSKLNPAIWYEPATRIVLTVEGYQEMENKIKELENDKEDNTPYFGWCDVEGCNNEGSCGGLGWRDTGYWTLCFNHSQDYRDKKPQPKMKDESIKRESSRDENGRLPLTLNPPTK